MSGLPKILLACPTSDYKLYCQDAWINIVNSITYPNLDVMIVDNSATDDNYKRLQAYPKDKNKNYFIEWSPASKDISLQKTLVKCCNIIRDKFLKDGYEYLFSLESDQFPPINVIEHLYSLSKTVAGLPYFHYKKNIPHLLVYNYIILNNTQIMDIVNNSNALCFCDGTVKPTIQNGLGCILIHKSVMRKVAFREGIEGESGYFKEGYHDYYFHLDLMMLGIKSYVDTKYFCEHYNSLDRWHNIYHEAGQVY